MGARYLGRGFSPLSRIPFENLFRVPLDMIMEKRQSYFEPRSRPLRPEIFGKLSNMGVILSSKLDFLEFDINLNPDLKTESGYV